MIATYVCAGNVVLLGGLGLIGIIVAAFQEGAEEAAKVIAAIVGFVVVVALIVFLVWMSLGFPTVNWLE